jgi:hypothetical protein
MELEGVERLVERLEFAAGLGREGAGGPEALVGRLGAVVDPVGAGALAGVPSTYSVCLVNIERSAA